MKKFFLCCGLALGLLVGSAEYAAATSFTYNFSASGYTNGQVLEGMVKDLATFTSETLDLRYYTDYGGGIGTGYTWGGAADIYIAFSAPVTNLSFRGGDGGGDNDAFAVSLYAFGTGAFLGTYSTPVFGDPWYTLTIPVANVGRLVFDPGNSGVLPGVKTGLGGLVITDFGYEDTVIPEPASLLLLGSGLVGLARLRRRR